MGIRRYLLNLLISVDQCGNAFLAGSPDETISSRVGRASLRGNRLARWAFEPAIDSLFLILAGQQRHCFESIEWDEQPLCGTALQAILADPAATDPKGN